LDKSRCISSFHFEGLALARFIAAAVLRPCYSDPLQLGERLFGLRVGLEGRQGYTVLDGITITPKLGA